MENRSGFLRAAFLIVSLAATSAGAQFVQYTPPGGLETPPETTREKIDENLRKARWRVGRAYFAPWLALRDLAYVESTVDSAPSGLTATVGLGVRGYLPLSRSWTLAAHVLPEAVYWEKQSARNRLNGRYGVGLFGQRRRLGVEATVTRADDARFFNRELEEQVDLRDDRAALTLHLDLRGGFTAYALGTVLKTKRLDDDPRFAELETVDREERIWRGGLRYRTRRGFLLGLGVEGTEVDFDEPMSPRSSSGTAPVADLGFEGRRLRLTAEAAFRSLEFNDPAVVSDFEGTTGAFRLEWHVLPPLEVQLYGSRNLVYSLSPVFPYYDEAITGTGVKTSLGRWGSLRFFAETGSNDYPGSVLTAVTRRDDFDTVGAQLEMVLGPLTLMLVASETEYDSNLAAFDRTVTIVRSQVSFGPGGGSVWW